MSIIDLSCTYTSGQIAGDPSRHPVVALKRMGKIENVGFNTSSIVLGSHTGTHMDAPRHFLEDGLSINEITPELCCGPVTIIDFRYFKENSCIQLDDVLPLPITERMLFVFGWDKNYGTAKYRKGWPYFSLEAAQYLTDKGMKLMVLDTISPDGPATGCLTDFQVHKALFQQGVTFVESIINTESIDFSKNYSLIALPLKLKGLDGSPCRVLLTLL